VAGKEVDMPRLSVYLSGGMHSGWQDRVKAAVPDIEWLDPREHGLTNPCEYADRDMEMIDQADIVFAYLEKDNPSGIGLAFEVGYALGCCTSTIIVNEKDDRCFDIVYYAADLRRRTLEQGIEDLRCLIEYEENI
jgi:nucleoside 2-deoxyribosyltransferase